MTSQTTDLPVTVYTPESPLRRPARFARAMIADMAASRELAWRLFVRDLIRPAREAVVIELVKMHAGSADDRQRALFEASLRAAFTIEEVRALAGALTIPPDSVQKTSDRHWTLAYIRPIEGRRGERNA